MVNVDAAADVGKLKDMLAAADVDFPVLYYGEEMDSPPAREWHIAGIPSAYLINPQGVIVAHPLARYNLTLVDLYERLSADPAAFAPAGLRASSEITSEEQIDIIVELYSPQRLPLKVAVDYTLPRFVWDMATGDMVECERTRPNGSEPEFEFEVDFEDSCEQTITLPVDVREYSGLEALVTVLIPGTAELNDGQGVWNMVRTEVYFPVGHPDTDEFFSSYPNERF